MEPQSMVFLAFTMIAFSAGTAVVVKHFGKHIVNTDYEKEIKELRHSLLQGGIDRRTFLYIRDNMKVEDLFNIETKRLDEMYKQKQLDLDTYQRMKRVLEVTFNQKLVKIYDELSPVAASCPTQ
ncbi:MAG: hypothetical protein WC325_08565 [Candidatus Bathyarchaeia archaeon]|jgi:hypothetical protein